MAQLPARDIIKRWREHPDLFVRECFKVTPDPWQDDVLKAFPHNQRMAMQACKGPGKLMPKSLVIDTPSGKRRWGDLKEGDLVFAEDGSPTEITKIYQNGIVKQYKVIFDDGSFTYCGAEHLWKVQGRTERRKKLGWAVLTTSQIIQRGVTVSNGRWRQKQFIIPIQGEAQYPEAQQPLDPYLVGVWLGDGYRGRPIYCKPYFEVEHEINIRGYITDRKSDGKTVTILGESKNFKKLECFNSRVDQKFVPDIYKYASVQQRIDLLCGLMDTDGCIGGDSHMEYNSTSRQLADDVVWLVRSLGGIAFIKDTVKTGKYKDEDGNYIVCKDCYRVTVTLPFNPFRIKHKAERWHRPQERYLTRYIAAIEEAHEEDSMCIEVAHPSHCYLANDFIVTHNTCLLAWLALNFLLTRPSPKIAATAITGDNLADNFWSECAKWMEKSEIFKQYFTWQKTRIFSNEKPETWWMSARTWSKSASPEEQGNTLAGLHADYILFILDESGDMPDAIMAAAEAALASCVEGHIVQAGNPTALEGPLYRAATSERHLWHVTEITADPDDPKRTPRVHVQWAKEQIEKYGRDNPWVLINVFGRFPPSSLNSLIGVDEVKAAMARYYRPQEYNHHARIISCDVARMGDDSSVIFTRQGLQAFMPQQHRGIDGTQGANIVARLWREWEADACFIDNTGGFGSSWIDNLNRLGFAPIGVHFNEKSTNPRYYNARTQMIFDCVEWIKKGGALPQCDELLLALTKTTYAFKGDAMLIEPKDSVKQKLGFSPDHMDALCLGFRSPITRSNYASGYNAHSINYNPLSRDHLTSSPSRNHSVEYNPLRRN